MACTSVFHLPARSLAPGIRCGGLRGTQLTWVEAPAVDLLLLPLLRQQDEPLLTCRLVKLRVRVPCPDFLIGASVLTRIDFSVNHYDS